MYLDEKFWLAVSFFIFIFLTYRYMRKVIINLIDTNIAKLSANVIQAENLRKEAELLLNEIRLKLASQDTENQYLLNEAKNNINKTIAEKKDLNSKELNIKYEESLKKIEQTKKLALMDLHKDFISLSHSMAEKYLKDHQDELNSDVEITKKFMNQ